ncbi:MAG: DegT/DnrJ/EryC1/StrS family aminotransferase [Litorilinea sp.]
MPERIYLSPPHMSGYEQEFVNQAFASNWVAPLGPQVDAFEHEFAQIAECGHALALNSGTAALHLALLLAGVTAGDEVLVSTLTFAGSVFPILYLNARPIFVDSESESWNLDPERLAATLQQRARQGRVPKALVLVHLYGQSADMEPIVELCEQYGVALIEDAAEALGARYRERAVGTFGQSAIYSFNGNKVITTSGGGMLVSDDADLITHARKLASQAREPTTHYEHAEIGYNYRMSNLLAGVGRGQLRVLNERIAARQHIFAQYYAALGALPGIKFMPEAAWGCHTRWLTTLTIDAAKFGLDRDTLQAALSAENIEARPVWKPMHMQPVFAGYETVGGEIAETLFAHGLCLPSGSNLTTDQLHRVVEVIQTSHATAIA